MSSGGAVHVQVPLVRAGRQAGSLLDTIRLDREHRQTPPHEVQCAYIPMHEWMLDNPINVVLEWIDIDSGEESLGGHSSPSL